MKTKVWEDIWFSVHYWPNDAAPEYGMSFKAYKISSIGDKPGYNKDGGGYTENLKEAEVFLDGDVKWDGCSNIIFDGNSHFCGMRNVDQLHECIKRIYALAAEEIPNFEGQ